MTPPRGADAEQGNVRHRINSVAGLFNASWIAGFGFAAGFATEDIAVKLLIDVIEWLERLI